jgi:DNA polymerase-3 subunit alpha
LTLDTSGPEITQHEQLGWERELLGLYLSHNPLDTYQELLAAEATPLNEIFESMEGLTVTVGGFISDVREITTKNGSKMAFVKLEDATSEIELVIFPKTYLKSSELWQRDKVVLAKGKVGGGRASAQGSELKVLVDDCRAISFEDAENYSRDPKTFVADLKVAAPSVRARAASPSVAARKRLYLRLADSNDQKILMSLKEKLDDHQGRTEVVLVTGPSDNKQIIKLPQTIDINEQCLRDLASIFGSTNVVVR